MEMGLGEDSAALGFPQVSAAAGIAGRQTDDNSVLNSPSQLAHEISCQRKGRPFPGGCPSSSGLMVTW